MSDRFIVPLGEHLRRMPQIVTGQSSREVDATAARLLAVTDVDLMRRAAQAFCEAIRQHAPSAQRILVCCGPGNNGGDGYFIAQELLHRGHRVELMLSRPPPPQSTASVAAAAWQYVDPGEDHTVAPGDRRVDLVVDAVLGAGAFGVVREHEETLLRRMSAIDAPVFSVDTPSGICVDSGAPLSDHHVNAHVTVAMIAPKAGSLMGVGAAAAGQVVVAPLGINESHAADMPDSIGVLAPARLPAVPRHGHKGTFGSLLVVGGSPSMGGAALLATESALATGVGAVRACIAEEYIPAMAARIPEAMAYALQACAPGDDGSLFDRVSACVLGPGLGQATLSRDAFEHAIAMAKMRDIPVVIDADALRLLAEKPSLSRGVTSVLTPHPGEAGSLLGCSTAQIAADRLGCARQIAKTYQSAVVLKGAGTIVAHPDGRSSINIEGGPALASAGSGDILAGVIGGLLARGATVEDATETGVWLHASASERLPGGPGHRGERLTQLMPHIAALVRELADRS